ncbi:uncharacterized protein [Oscarella lobularis]|uniref:uncharacterized protein n=1 Tax=Oscarella lobularis TaxID=121494 RepID=UPI0033136126
MQSRAKSLSDSGVVSASEASANESSSSSSWTDASTDRLHFWKKQINQNVKGSYYVVGRAFHEILNKEQLLKTSAFVPWVRENFGLTRSTAYEYLRAYKVVDLLQRNDPSLPVPSTLSHFRVFNKCTLEDGGLEACRVWRRVLEGVPENCQRLTAKVVLSSRRRDSANAGGGDDSTSTTGEESRAPRNRHRKRHVARDDAKIKLNRQTTSGHGHSHGGRDGDGKEGTAAAGSSDDSGAPSSSKSPTSSEKTEDTSSSANQRGSSVSDTSPREYDSAYSPKWLLNLVAETGEFEQLETVFGDEDWPKQIYCNLLRLFPDDFEFHEQGSYIEKVIENYQLGKFTSGLFVLEVAHSLATFARVLSYPHCYLNRKIQRFELHGGNDAKQAVLFYMGNDAEGFLKTFLPHGIIPGLNSWSAGN